MTDSDAPSPRQTAAALRRQGFSLRQIARRIGVHHSVVGRWVHDLPPATPNDTARAEQLSSRRDDEVYQQALTLRRAGWTYGMIAAELGIAKSTLSGWLKHTPRGGALALQRSHDARIASGITKRRAHQALAQTEIAAAADDISRRFVDGISERDLFIAGLMLYWAEGDKTQTVSLTNSDPLIIKTYIQWLRHSFDIAASRLRCEVHLYPDVDLDAAEQYWSDLTLVPRSQFYPAQIDLRSGKSVNRRGKLPYGTIHVKVIGKGTTALHRQILGFIAGLSALMVQ